ncbi:MAG: hypothetical protein E6916_02780 [Clostridium cochlearium]|uniref:hypothetical protein n=1 Tax=Clostridium cochlearium TaxID=1494 RepID=UPI00280C0D31|nr:hypothetical protein [Clostridium cochlearium]MDU1442422.1 hypothetical protein [Clostridium cochlearium]
MSDFNLSYTMEKKTNKILELKHQLNNTRSNLIIPCGLIGISVCYLILAHNRYADYASFIFTSTNSTISKLKILDFGIIMLLIISYILLRSKIAKYNNLKKSYEILRKDIIHAIDSEFCNCSEKCTCKDTYIKYMEDQGIDLIF